MEWDDIKIFLAAVRAGSYTAAARHLGINRTTVGRRIEALEARLGTELFEYRTTSPYPSQAGMELLITATAMEEAVLGLDARLKGECLQFPTIRLASSAGIASEFMPELAEFQRLNPNIVIELLSEPDPLAAITHRRCDLALAILRTPPKRLDGMEIGTLSQAVYGAKTRASNRPLGWGHEIDQAIPAQWTSANLSGPRAEAARQPSFNSWPALKQAVLAGIGTANLWCFAAQFEPSLERLSPPDPRASYPLWLLRRATFPPSPAQRLLMEYLQTHLAARLRDP